MPKRLLTRGQILVLALTTPFSLGLATMAMAADPPSLEQRIQALERVQSGVFYATVNHPGTISARNFPEGKVRVRNLRTGLYEIDFSPLEVYDAAILVSVVTSDGSQPWFINAGNDPNDPHHKFWVETWKGPSRTGDGVHKGNFQSDNANFRFVVLVPK